MTEFFSEAQMVISLRSKCLTRLAIWKEEGDKRQLDLSPGRALPTQRAHGTTLSMSFSFSSLTSTLMGMRGNLWKTSSRRTMCLSDPRAKWPGGLWGESRGGREVGVGTQGKRGKF